MPKHLLIGTRNPSRIELVRAILHHNAAAVTLITLEDLNIVQEIDEDGRTTAENAEKKARGYYTLSGVPTLAIDGGLHIDRLPTDKQPGIYVRRNRGLGSDATELDIRNHYLQELDQVGGESAGTWTVSHALAVSAHQVIVEGYTFDVFFTTRCKGEAPPGRLLDTMMIDPQSGKYYTELEIEERPYYRANVDFILGHIHLL